MTHCHTLIATLRQRGYRITPQREMIVEALAHAGGHVTAEDIFDRVHDRTSVVNIATIYRTLDLLVAIGLASRADLWDGRVVYTTFQHGPHVHLVCRNCGEVYNADSQLFEPLGEQIQSRYRFIPDLQHLSMLGLCLDCSKSSKSV
jgi:Fur family ferric uptake transcriptional regulator